MTKATSLSDTTALRDEVVPRRVRQFGSARDGLREWRLQRLTAIALIPLSLYFAASILSLATSDRKTAADCLAQPVPALLVILVVLAGVTHALIGVRSVVLDYVRTRTRLLAAELLSSIIQPLQIKRDTARVTRSRRVAKGPITHRRAETAGGICQFGWLDNGQTSSTAMGSGALSRHGLSTDLSSLAGIGGRTDSRVAHRTAQQPSKWIRNELDRPKQV